MGYGFQAYRCFACDIAGLDMADPCEHILAAPPPAIVYQGRAVGDLMGELLGQTERRVQVLEACLAEALRWMRYNPPVTGMVTLDRTRDAERVEICSRAKALLNTDADPP